MENYKLFIGELLNELSYRTSNGIVNLKDKNQISLLSEILLEWGFDDIRDELISNLLGEEDDKKYKNSILNKIVKYRDDSGNEKEAPVGNLLRTKEDSPGRKAAEKLLPNEGTPERDKINNELGGENQPGRDIEKEKENKDDGDIQDTPSETAMVFKGSDGDAYRESLSPEDPEYKPNKNDESDVGISNTDTN